MTDPVLASLLGQHEHRKSEDGASLTDAIISEYRAALMGHMIPLHTLESRVAEAEREVTAWLSRPAAEAVPVIEPNAIAREVERTRNAADGDPDGHRRLVRRNLGLQGYSRAEITASDRHIRQEIAGQEVQEPQPAQTSVRQNDEPVEEVPQKTTADWAGPGRSEIPEATRILEAKLSDDPEGQGLSPYGMAKRIALRMGTFEALSALATAADRDRAEKSSVNEIQDHLRAQVPAVDEALNRCMLMPRGEVSYPIPSPLVPLALVAALSKDEIARCVNEGEFALDDMFLFREREARQELARQADRILEDLKGATVSGWARQLPYMLATRQAQVAELETRLRDLRKEYLSESPKTADAAVRPGKSDAAASPAPALGKRRRPPKKPASKPRKTTPRAGNEDRFDPMGLVAIVALVAVIASGVYWRQEIFDWSSDMLMAFVNGGPAPDAPDIDLGLAPLASLDAGGAPAVDKQRQATFEAFLNGEDG